MAKKLAFDKLLFVAVVALVLFGLALVFSASGAVAQARGGGATLFLRKQALAAALGLAMLFALVQIDYRLLRRRPVVYTLLGTVVALLVAVLFFPPINGSRRWLLVGPFTFQASELAKFALVVYLAYQIEDKAGPERERQLLIAAVAATGLLGGLVQLEPDFGTAAILTALALLMLFVAGVRWRWVGGALGAGGVVAALLIFAAPYRMDRIRVFLDPDRAPLEEGYQPLQSLIAVGSGGLAGRGLGESRQKLLFLPHPHSDFIFSILAEELGLAGCLALVGLFGLFVWRAVRAALRAPDPFGRHVALGFTGLIALQALLNVSVALCLLPTTGITLPFISYGGSSLVVTLSACGVLLNVSQHA